MLVIAITAAFYTATKFASHERQHSQRLCLPAARSEEHHRTLPCIEASINPLSADQGKSNSCAQRTARLPASDTYDNVPESIINAHQSIPLSSLVRDLAESLLLCQTPQASSRWLDSVYLFRQGRLFCNCTHKKKQ